VRGCSAEERAAWQLPARVEAFAYLSSPGAVNTIPGVDDARDFADVRAAMHAVGIDAAMQARLPARRCPLSHLLPTAGRLQRFLAHHAAA